MEPKRLIILRGLSGSGKSRKAKELLAADTFIVTTDDFWLDLYGHYKFDYSRLGEAHQWARNKAEGIMKEGKYNVIIDNTNARWWEMFPYLQMAHQYSYDVLVIMVGGISPEDIALYASRNTHGVPIEIIRRQADNFEMMMDPQMGCFLEGLRQEISEALKTGMVPTPFAKKMASG